jgi:hypothetical protein
MRRRVITKSVDDDELEESEEASREMVREKEYVELVRCVPREDIYTCRCLRHPCLLVATGQRNLTN